MTAPNPQPPRAVLSTVDAEASPPKAAIPIAECGCIERVNDMLAEYSAELVTNVLTRPYRVAVETVAIWQSGKRRKRPPVLMATYCPFCGNRYPQRSAALPAQGGEAEGPKPGTGFAEHEHPGDAE